MLETINKMGPIIEPTTLFVLIMFSILIVTALCMQPKNKYKKLLARKRAGSTGGNKKNKQLYLLRTLDQISETNLLPEYLKNKLFYIRDCAHHFKRNHLFTLGSRLETYYIPEIYSAFTGYKASLEYGGQEKLKTATLFSRISSQLPMKNLREKK